MPTLVVQMGHAGRTTGSTGAPGEQELTNRLGQAAYARLNGRGGWQVRLIAADVPAGHYKGDAFVAFHADGNNNPNVDGASVGYQTSEGDRFSGDWQANYTALGWPGTWHDDNYTANLSGYYGVSYAVAQGNRRAFIAEVGTITNPADKTFITSEAGIAAAVDSVGYALGIITPPKPPDTTGTTPESEIDMTVITCDTPNRAGLLLPTGQLLDITNDATARQYAQARIEGRPATNANPSSTPVVWPELKVLEATWNALLAASI